jgi:hypothetical protein
VFLHAAACAAASSALTNLCTAVLLSLLQFALLQNRQTAENKRLRSELDQHQQELKRLQVRQRIA